MEYLIVAPFLPVLGFMIRNVVRDYRKCENEYLKAKLRGKVRDSNFAERILGLFIGGSWGK